MSPFSGACPLQRSEAPVAAESAGAGAVGAPLGFTVLHEATESGLGFVDIKGPALNVLAVQGGLSMGI